MFGEPNKKKRKLNQETNDDDDDDIGHILYKLKTPNIIKQSILESNNLIIECVALLIGSYCWGYDDQIYFEIGGTIKDWQKITGFDQDFKIYQFIKQNENEIKGIYPSLYYRQNGIFKEIWNNLPFIMDKSKYINFYQNGGEINLKLQIKNMIETKCKMNDKKWNVDELNELDSVWNEIKIYYQQIMDINYNDPHKYFMSVAPSKCVWLPIGDILWIKSIDLAKQKGIPYRQMMDFLHKEMNDNIAIYECKYFKRCTFGPFSLKRRRIFF